MAPEGPNPESPSGGRLALDRVCGDIAAVVRRAWGRGPVRTSTPHWAGADMLVVLMSDGHTSAERTLREGTHLDRLIDDRRLLQAAVAGELTGIVEGATHRRVATTLSATRLDPNLSAEIFLFEAGGSPGAAVPGSGASPPV